MVASIAHRERLMSHLGEVRDLLQSHKVRVAERGCELDALLNFMPSLHTELPDQPLPLPLSPEPPRTGRTRSA